MTDYDKNEIIKRMVYLLEVLDGELPYGLEWAIKEFRELVSKLRSC